MYYIILSVAVLVMLYVMITYVRIKKMPEGTPMMIKLAGIIRGGSKTFLRIQFRTVAVVVVFLAIVFSLFIVAPSRNVRPLHVSMKREKTMARNTTTTATVRN